MLPFFTKARLLLRRTISKTSLTLTLLTLSETRPWTSLVGMMLIAAFSAMNLSASTMSISLNSRETSESGKSSSGFLRGKLANAARGPFARKVVAARPSNRCRHFTEQRARRTERLRKRSRKAALSARPLSSVPASAGTGAHRQDHDHTERAHHSFLIFPDTASV